MANILGIGASSLQAIQQALNTTGHNIANANTEGYSRQEINMSANQAQRYGFGYLGQGVSIQSVQRSFDQFLTNQVQDFTSSQSRYNIFAEFSGRVDDIMAMSSNSMNSSIQNFFSAIQDIASSPSTLPERQAVMGEAQNLLDRYNNFNKVLGDLNTEVNNLLRSSVAEINSLSDRIASLNEQIVSARLATNGAEPNDMLDQRDRLVKELAEKVTVSTVEQSDGSLSVFVGNGQSIVVGSSSSHLTTLNNPYDASQLEIGMAGQVNQTGISQFLRGGEIQGLMDFKNRVLEPAQTELGLVILGLAETVNSQHALGMDLNDATGGQFFQTGGINVAANSFNTGSSAPAVTLSDISQLRPSEYQLDFDGAQWQLTRLNDGTSVSGAGPLVLDGMTVDVTTGTPTIGDSFRFNPAQSATNNIQLAFTDPRKIAAASLVKNTVSSGNGGEGVLSGLQVLPGHTLPLAGDITLTFNPDALGAGIPGFDVTGGPGGTIAYDPFTESAGKTFTFGTEGISFSISDIPLAGDSFVISNNAGSYGDNSNIVSIGGLQNQSLLNGGQDSFQELYGGMVAKVGVTTQQAQSSLEVETTLLEQAERYKDSGSGVNLDEEAASMLKYQQQYQAAAQLIKVADEMFQTLIRSV